MSNKKRIKYSIFSSRKNFNIINWISSDKEKTYESFISFLEKINIIPPEKEYFDRAYDFYEKNIKPPPVIVEKPVVIKKPVKNTRSTKTVKTPAKPRRRRKRSTKQSQSKD